MLIRGITTFVACLSLLAVPAQGRTDEELDRMLSDLPPQQQAVYRQQLLQLERVARRLLDAIPNRPQVNFLLAAGESSVNAGATFGKVMVTEGMMHFVGSDDELAMILGHELAHVTEGHVTRGAINSTLLGISSAIVGTVFPGGDQATSVVGQLFLNHFNQNQERQADQVGLRYAYQAGYDPHAAAQVMRRMAEDVPQTATAGFFSSHPSSAERFAALEKRAAQLAGRPAPDRVVDKSESPRLAQGRDEAACRKALPYFYRASETTRLKDKVALYRRGLRICPESPRAHFELADAYSRLGQERRAAAALREVLRYQPSYPGARQRLDELQRRLSRVNP